MRGKSRLLFVAVPLLLMVVCWGVKRQRDTLPAFILGRYPQNEEFRSITEAHLVRHLAGTSFFGAPSMGVPSLDNSPQGKPILVTTYLEHGRTDLIEWCNVDDLGQGTLMGESVGGFSTITTFHPFRFSSRQQARLRALMVQMPPSEPPKLRGDVLIVSFEDDGQWQTRVYDKKVLPGPVRQMLTLTRQKMPLP